MATFVDPTENDEVDNQNPSALDEMEADAAAEASSQSFEEVVEETPQVDSADEEPSDLPDKYQGKSAKELAEMHSNLEKLMGKQSQEVGELRKAFDAMVKDSIIARNNEAQAAPEPEVEDVDFFTDPKAAIERAVSNHPTLKQAQAVAAEMAKKEAIAALQSRHPDMKEVLGNEKFQEWVGASKIRTQLYQNADRNYDYDSANELLDLWKERQTVVKQTAAVEKVAQKNEVKKAATGSGRSNPTGQTTRKTYRRRDIIELMQKDPKRYESLQDEILKAYSEGRVK